MGCVCSKNKSIAISQHEETYDELPSRLIKTPTVIIENDESPVVIGFDHNPKKIEQITPSTDQLFVVEELNSNLEESQANSPIIGARRVDSIGFNFLK